jgi:16S rRNA (guanine966-N2)-methyltransferase
VRIIAGEWRGRRVRFAPVETLRPTPDRVRETLFNWLQPIVRGSRCLDLFAGSGALGLEALSRGAAQVVFVDRERRVTEQLRATLAELGSSRGEVRQERAEDYLQHAAQPFDVVFLDPPFGREVSTEVCRTLEERGWLAPQACVYLELPARASLSLPENWTLARSKRAGEVGYHLARRNEAAAPAREGT